MRGKEKAQAAVEIMMIASIALVFLALNYLFFVNEQASVGRQSDFLQARKNVEEVGLLLSAGNRVEGFYSEFQIPLFPQGFSLNLSNSEAVGTLPVNGQETQIAFPLNVTLNCVSCPLGPGTYWISNYNKVLKIASK
ncbi:MAG: hypothetical protein V1717_00530 [Candidatus Micrarchaeota archaeon]